MECDDADSDENIKDVECVEECCEIDDDLTSEMIDCNNGVGIQKGCELGAENSVDVDCDITSEMINYNLGFNSDNYYTCHALMRENSGCNKDCDAIEFNNDVLVDDITNELIQCNKNKNTSRLNNKKNTASEEEGCSSEIDEAEILTQCDTLMTKDYLPEGLVQDTCVTVAPGEGEIPKSMLSDTDYDVLAFPTVYCGVKRKFKIPLTPHQILKSDLRKYDRRGATNIPWLFTKFSESRLRRLVNKAIFALRKTRKEKNLTVKQLLDPEKLSNLIEHDDAYKILQADRSSPAHWEFRKKRVMGMIRQLGPPTFFCTTAETRWTPLIRTLFTVLKQEHVCDDDAATLNKLEKLALLKADPSTCAQYYHH